MATATPTPVPTAKPVDTRGLANQVIGETKVCAVTQTELIYRGYEIADLAEKATFEGVAHLVLVGHKPTDAELAAFDLIGFPVAKCRTTSSSREVSGTGIPSWLF